ncbi:MAG: hypothetical protein DWQ47_04715 [Acidobacteria bacterium]|nr:MAG: hypothetical protein DWQ32_08265 [Acidobacteriota bacterium]REK01688.1 MAG: hypothetical protein DWQ38_04700 [Acidobacteriota bacterium]REK14644.1 MAG: hypothetical protein DWQ43_13955 [Acidobacteriota bacterium]REK45359.1 MAG: hypothetical protein DWQ47_04715 [Acidobacteriota bacterium]
MTTLLALEGNDSKPPLSQFSEKDIRIAKAERSMGLWISEVLTAQDSEQLLLRAKKIEWCSEESNIYLVKEDEVVCGERSNSWYGRLQRCSARLCPSCNARHWAKARSSYGTGIEEAISHSESYKATAVTLTFPAELFQGLTFTEAYLKTNDLWRKFYRSRAFTDFFEGGINRQEVTNGRDSKRPVRIHFHLLLFSTQAVAVPNRAFMIKIWTDFLKKHLPDLPGLEQNAVQVGYQRVLSHSSLFKIFNYMMKPDQLSSLDEGLIIQLASLTRFPRMICDFGCFKEWRKAHQTGQPEDPILDNRDITDNREESTSCDPEEKSDSDYAFESEVSRKTNKRSPEIPVEVMLSEYRKMIVERRRQRMKELREEYPLAEFITLAGLRF